MVQRDNSDDREILDSLRGFVFLGTPHRGSKLTPIGEMISLLGYWRGSHTTLLKAMRIGSKENDELHDHIFSFIRKREMFDATLCIVETESEKIWGLPITHVSFYPSAHATYGYKIDDPLGGGPEISGDPRFNGHFSRGIT
jgi:hypothetical protein